MLDQAAREAREQRWNDRIAGLYASDPEFAAARPDQAVSRRLHGLRLPDVVSTIFDAYAHRPALRHRSIELSTDLAGRTIVSQQDTFDTITYADLGARVRNLAAALLNTPVKPGDRVAILGSTSADYAVVDISLTQLGAVSVPLQTTAPSLQLRPILAEAEPSLVATSIDYLDKAIALLEAVPGSKRLLVFDAHPEVDDHHDALATAAARLPIPVETLHDAIDRGRDLPHRSVTGDGADPLALLIYTSGSTGAPKGAMYTERMVTDLWSSDSLHWDQTLGVLPSISLNFLPMSHVMGRGVLYGTLAAGGVAYFAARSDLSSFFDDLASARPTQLSFVPRIWDMLHQRYESEAARQQASTSDDEDRILSEMRQHLLGGRFVSALTGSASISADMTAWVERLLDMHLTEGYGSTEAGMITVDEEVLRPTVLDYKLVDVPELGYYVTDVPFPRGELLVKSTLLFPGYFNRPDVTASVVDDDGYYRTGDVVAEIAPDRLRYLDRRNNVLKLSQGEFVTVSKLEAAFTNSPLVRQIFLYGNSSQPYLLAVVVPTQEAQEPFTGTELKDAISASLMKVASTAELQSHEVPRDFIVDTTPFTLENGLLTGLRKLAWPRLKKRYGAELEQLYTDLAAEQSGQIEALRLAGSTAPALETVCQAVRALLGAGTSEVTPDAHFSDLGGDSLSALSLSNLLADIYGMDVPVGVIVSTTNDLSAVARYVEAGRSASASRPTFTSTHGTDAKEVHARDLTLDKFIDPHTLHAARSLPAAPTAVRTVLLTGATGFLGRYLALEWLQRMNIVNGTVICLVRARSDDEARARLDKTFHTGDPKLLAHYDYLASEHLQVLAGDKGEPNLGLAQPVWQRLADTVDLIVDAAALVNHVLPYSQLFGPNASGTAELIRVAVTAKLKPIAYVSTIGVGQGIDPDHFDEDGDIRRISPTRVVSDVYANGYSTSKWAGEVLLREAHDVCRVPVSVFRCDMILADLSYAGQLNLPDMFTRMMFSLVASGVAPKSFYQLDADGNRQRAHYDGLPVEFVAEAISTLGVRVATAPDPSFDTYHVTNSHDDGLGMDEFVDWLVDAGYSIGRIDDYAEWLTRFDVKLRALPERQRKVSLLPLLHNYQRPESPVNGGEGSNNRFSTAVREAQIGREHKIPHVTRDVIVKYVTDLELLGLLSARQLDGTQVTNATMAGDG